MFFQVICSQTLKFSSLQTFRQRRLWQPTPVTLAWKIPWMEEPGRLQFMGSLRVGHDWATSLSRIGEGNGNPFQCSCLENPRDGGAWWAAVYGVAQSRTRLKRLRSSSSSSSKLSEDGKLSRDQEHLPFKKIYDVSLGKHYQVRSSFSSFEGWFFQIL